MMLIPVNLWESNIIVVTHDKYKNWTFALRVVFNYDYYVPPACLFLFTRMLLSWQAFEGQEFTGNMYVLEEGSYPDLRAMGCVSGSSSILSLQTVGFVSHLFESANTLPPTHFGLVANPCKITICWNVQQTFCVLTQLFAHWYVFTREVLSWN